jgi:hypothetical protein
VDDAALADCMIATYSLSKCLASFEFFNWLVMVQADGADEICLDIEKPKLKNFNLDDVMRRFHSIIEPGPRLAGLPHRCCYGRVNSPIDAVASQLLPWYMSGRRFQRLMSVKPPVICDYTVTIRDNDAGAHSRDSNRFVWQQFAEEIGAVLIDDYYRKEIHLHDRMALYAGARMNFGVCNGPIHLLSLTPYPVAMFVNGQSARNSQTRWGMWPDKKYPWMLENQTMIWKDDSNLDVMLRTFDSMKL